MSLDENEWVGKIGYLNEREEEENVPMGEGEE